MTLGNEGTLGVVSAGARGGLVNAFTFARLNGCAVVSHVVCIPSSFNHRGSIVHSSPTQRRDPAAEVFTSLSVRHPRLWRGTELVSKPIDHTRTHEASTDELAPAPLFRR